MSNTLISQSESADDLNEGFCIDEVINTSEQGESVYISDADVENYFLEITNNSGDETDMSVLRCTSQTVRGLFYNQHRDKSVASSDQRSLIQVPQSAIDSSNSGARLSIHYKDFCNELEPSESLSSDSGCCEPSIEPIIKSDAVDSSSSTDRSLKVTCKTICSQIMKPITAKILKKFKKKAVEGQTHIEGQATSSVPSNVQSERVCCREPMALIQNRRVPIKILTRGYRPGPARLDDGVTEQIKSNFNQYGDFIYYYV